ncbi:MAG: methyltransferase domain-containing protein [Pseudonocardiales bacterium]|nr:methyltransferase domain-containing protein [Pseudonocardiales bacterium]
MSQEKANLVSTSDEVSRLYDRFAAQCAASMFGDSMSLHLGYRDDPDSEVSFSEAADRLTDLMTEKLKIGSGSHVLDVGCGVGGPGVRIARLTGARVTGISVSQEQIAVANSLAESAGLAERVVFQQANAMEMLFPAQSFDAAIALESLPHMPDRGQVLTQIGRALRPGGRLVLTDLFERAPIPAAKQPAVDRLLNNFMSTLVRAEDYPPLLRHAGLWFEEILDISEQTLPTSYVWLQSELETIMFGDEVTGRFDGIDVIIPEVGYLMVVAKRPKR